MRILRRYGLRVKLLSLTVLLFGLVLLYSVFSDYCQHGSYDRKVHEDGDSLHYEYNTFDFLKDESALISSNERIRDGTRTVHKTEPCIIAADSLDGVWSKGGNISARDVYNVTSLRRVSAGGAYTPADCNPQEFVAVIIPYRNRRSNLRILLFYLHTFLQRQKIQYTIFVVELAYPTVFNRGILANVGYLTAKDIGRFTCYVIHDVDRLPTRDANLYRCSRQPHHLAVSSSKYGYALPYGHYIGGVIAFTPAQFEAINGFSNAYFGWGREDDDLRKRITSKGYTIERPDATVGVYEELPHPESDTANPNNPISDSLLFGAEKRMSSDGLNRVMYRRLALEFRHLYTWVYVNTSEIDVMKYIFFLDPDVKRAYAKLRKPS